MDGGCWGLRTYVSSSLEVVATCQVPVNINIVIELPASS
jgi:hypothetical protein